jgi:hypothetical protein
MKTSDKDFSSKDRVKFIDKRFPNYIYDVMAITSIPKSMCVCGISFEDSDHFCDDPNLLREITGHHQKIYLNLTGVGPLTPVSGALLQKVDN